ncbi:YmL10 [Ptychographa xylographoides]|nr:YmL10 [Ptychographa xylographoides]
MPPRLAFPLILRQLFNPSPLHLAPYLLPCVQTPISRHASILSSLSDNPGAYKKKIRRGRGPSSGKGKTSGRGHKGQKARGTVPRDFNGGQTPLEVVHGTRGFVNVFSVNMVPLNLARVQSWIDQGRLDPSRPITIKELSDSNCVGQIGDGIKLLAAGADKLRTPINIIVSRASASAIAAVEKAGGNVMTRFYTPFAIKRILRGTTDPINSLRSQKIMEQEDEDDDDDDEDEDDDGDEDDERSAKAEGVTNTVSANLMTGTTTTIRSLTRFPGFAHRLPDPTSRKDIEYYRDPAHRGYLSHLVTEGQTPSLFFKVPRTGKGVVGRKIVAKRATAENRIW